MVFHPGQMFHQKYQTKRTAFNAKRADNVYFIYLHPKLLYLRYLLWELEMGEGREGGLQARYDKNKITESFLS